MLVITDNYRFTLPCILGQSKNNIKLSLVQIYKFVLENQLPALFAILILEIFNIMIFVFA